MTLLGVDIGGTFTDFVLVDDDGRVRVHKRPTSPADPAISFLQGLMELEVGPAAEVVHGSTIATNALLEYRGARTALITTTGFADVIEIGRQHRPDLYALVPVKPPPLVPRAWRFEVDERVTADGQVLVPLARSQVEHLVERLTAAGIEAVAICLLFSFLRREHEQLVKDVLAQSGANIYLTTSSDLLPEYREYERVSTTVINAYVAPLIDRYLARVEAGLAGRALHIMQSNGGTISARMARAQPARLALSGPAGGVVGAFEAARQALTPPGLAGASAIAVQVITFDVGGTSTDVALCDGRIPLTAEGEIGGMPLRFPLIDVHTIGAGGGSLASVDRGGALRVGPASAGAEPGPACYGRGGTQATVTDANLVLGRLDPLRFLGGRMVLDEAAAYQAVTMLASALRAPSPEAAAWDVVRVANAAIERAIRKISVERGHDPRPFTLVAFGGAGPLHVCELARHLGLRRVLVPRVPGVLSALGMLIADRVKDYSQTILRPGDAVSASELLSLFAPLEARARSDMLAEGVSTLTLELSLDTRYKGQSFEISVPLSVGTEELGQALIAQWLLGFHTLHAQRYGHAHPGDPVELVTIRLRAIGHTPKPAFEHLPARAVGRELEPVGQRAVWFEIDGRLQAVETRLYERDALCSGDRLAGPVLVLQLDATTVVPPGWQGVIDSMGHLLLEWASGTNH